MKPQPLPLRDIHLPQAIDWWPPAIGWWLLPILILLSIALLIWVYELITRKTAIKTAKKQLLQIKQDNTSEDIHKLTLLSELLRRVAISVSPRNESASLTGLSWLKYLDKTVKGSPFTQGEGRYLADAHYKKTLENNIDMTQIVTICENWLKAQKNRK